MKIITEDNKTLNINHRRNAIILNLEEKTTEDRHAFMFYKSSFAEVVDYLESLFEKCWKGDLNIIEAYSFGSDYNEYYDREFDNEGGLKLSKEGKGIILTFHKPYSVEPHNKLYQFNKTTLGTFLYDAYKILGREVPMKSIPLEEELLLLAHKIKKKNRSNWMKPLINEFIERVEFMEEEEDELLVLVHNIQKQNRSDWMKSLIGELLEKTKNIKDRLEIG